ncbi:hypothetical protein [Paractinoplanes maris]|uniref:hypothetical protein n=1 Tax=Paractinoplanes maris TaxID=1734446 RepID=UPI0020226D92|nr:hypothetical protein [Actinoplanes maris]
MSATDDDTTYGLHRPTMNDAHEAMHRVHGVDGPAVWAQALTAAGLSATSQKDDDLPRLLEAMTRLDPVSRLCAQALRIRLSSHTHLSAAHTLTRR